eukprot:1397909-Rhodomonas_salina.3
MQSSLFPELTSNLVGISASSVGKCVYVFLWGKHVVRYDTEADTYETMVPLPLPEYAPSLSTSQLPT